MNDPIHAEAKLTLAEAALRLPAHRGDGRLNPATLTRWIQRGCVAPSGRRVRLEAVRCGSRWLTSEGALTRFAAQLTAGAADPAPPRQSVGHRSASEAAARTLDDLGA